MPARRGPTLRSQLLGKRLRELREGADLTLKDVASYMQRDPSSISRMEAGVHPARVPDVLAYLTLCEASDPGQKDSLVNLAKDSWQIGWWDKYADRYGDTLVDRIWLESRAVEIKSFQAIVLPGHLQTRAYAYAVIRVNDVGQSQDFIDQAIDLRMHRQQAIYDNPLLHVRAVLDESILRRQVGDRKTMAEQLAHLAKLTSRPNTNISIIPYASGAHPSPDGCFDVFALDEPYSDIGYVATPAGAMFLERGDADHLNELYDRLSSMALSQADSRSLMLDLASDLEDL